MNTPPHSLSDHDFGKLSKTESNARARTRLLILHQYSIGTKTNDIAKLFSIHFRTALRTRSRYLTGGLDSIYDQPRSGRRPRLSKEHEASFKQSIVEAQALRGGGRLVASDIQKIASEQYQVEYTEKGIYTLLNRIGMSWISARSQHPKADKDKQEEFKKNLKIR